MTFNQVLSFSGLIGSLATILLGVVMIRVIRRLNDPHKISAESQKHMYQLVVCACVIAMVVSGLRAWQLTLLGK
jgi:hypothetical protein